MEFSSLFFIYAFLPVSLALFYITPKKKRKLTLLILSVIFCGLLGIYFLALMTIFTLLGYFIGFIIEKTRNIKPVSIAVFCIGIISYLFLLFLFRKELFANIINISDLSKLFIPVGISYTCLSGIGYLADVFGGKIRSERNFFNYSLYVCLFTKLPYGPIIDYQKFKENIQNNSYSIKKTGKGIEIFVIGLAKKVLLADNLYLLYSAVNETGVSKISALSAWLGIIAFSLSLYYALSGLSDMGTGLSYCFGFSMPYSFNYPFISAGINDFCHRWHIPVTSWFEKRINNPLALRMTSGYFKSVVFVLTWCITGLWYELSINKLVFGLIIGISGAVEQIIAEKKTLKTTSVFYTFFIILFSSIFFVGESLLYSLKYFLAMVGGNNNIADTTSFYLFKSYIPILIIAFYFATNLLYKTVLSSRKKIVHNIIEFISPFITLILLVICTAIISYAGKSEVILINL